MSVGLKGLWTPPEPEYRDIAYLDVSYNGNQYDWSTYVPRGSNIGEYLASIEQRIYAEIDAKEAEWAALTPKTKTIVDPLTGEEQTVDIEKSEIVRADYPDYYAKRRNEYPSIGDQLGAVFKGVTSADYIDIEQKILEVKNKYPKPTYIQPPPSANNA